jgi:hypothetical protein
MSYKVEKDWEHKGLRCVVIAGSIGHRCGYVGVSASHPLYGIGYDDTIPLALLPVLQKVKEGPIGKRGIMDLLTFQEDNPRVGILFDVHGSITYSGGKDGYPVESDLWWFGYDCAHVGDAKDPSILGEEQKEFEARYPHFYDDGVIRDLDYCISECESLADQILEVAG